MTSVSVIIPVYNHESYVAQALQSVIDQVHDDLEIICIDDGSSDASIAVAQDTLARGGRAYRLIPQNNGGAHHALDRGASLATGKLLMFLNSDDLYAPTRASLFAGLWDHLRNTPEFWGFSQVYFVDDDGMPADPVELGIAHLSDYNNFVAQGQFLGEMFAWHNVAITSGNLVMPKELYLRTQGFASYRMVHDWDLALKLLAICGPVVLQEELYGYRLHSSNTFRSIANSDAVDESLQVRDTYAATLIARMETESYVHRGIPFVEYFRLKVPMKAASSGG